jgi:hypothetical protein
MLFREKKLMLESSRVFVHGRYQDYTFVRAVRQSRRIRDRIRSALTVFESGVFPQRQRNEVQDPHRYQNTGP